jgi:hypothetical protein
MPIYHIQWDTQTNVSTLQMDNKLLHYLYNNFGPVVHFVLSINMTSSTVALLLTKLSGITQKV